MKLEVGDVVKIADILSHDPGRCGQVGVVYKYAGYYDSEHNYYVISWDVRNCRFWGCGFTESEIQPLGFKFEGLIDAYAFWLSDDCWKNTDHSAFKTFMESLKIIRQKHRAVVKERTR